MITPEENLKSIVEEMKKNEIMLPDFQRQFGIRTLDFRFDVSAGQEPDFLTADIAEYIEGRTFLAAEYGKSAIYAGKKV